MRALVGSTCDDKVKCGGGDERDEDSAVGEDIGVKVVSTGLHAGISIFIHRDQSKKELTVDVAAKEPSFSSTF